MYACADVYYVDLLIYLLTENSADCRAVFKGGGGYGLNPRNYDEKDWSVLQSDFSTYRVSGRSM